MQVTTRNNAKRCVLMTVIRISQPVRILQFGTFTVHVFENMTRHGPNFLHFLDRHGPHYRVRCAKRANGPKNHKSFSASKASMGPRSKRSMLKMEEVYTEGLASDAHVLFSSTCRRSSSL